MLVERATVPTTAYSWAYSEDIPGSRCGPEDGPWPRSFQVLSEFDLLRELHVLAKPQMMVFDRQGSKRVDSVNFQPSPTTKTQDRYIVTQLEILGRKWSLTGVFDGHLGDVTVEHVAYHLPIIIRDFLRDAMSADPTSLLSPHAIAEHFSQSILAFDDAIANDVLSLFGGIDGLDRFSDSEIRNIINDQHSGGANWKKARLCMYGTTALVALVDPDHENLWVANLGDCQASVVYRNEIDDDWTIERLTTDHNGDNDDEVERVQREHPGEPECVIDRRVLGAIAPFRCLGDVPFKQPPVFTRRILYNLFPGFHNTKPWEEFLVRNRTPPYITARPEVTHCRLVDGASDAGGTTASNRTVHGTATRNLPAHGPRFLILSSDGFADLCSGEGQQRILRSWADKMVSEPVSPVSDNVLVGASSPTSPTNSGDSNNMALRLLRRALGDDRYSVSRVLTLDMDEAWIDDTAIIVQTL